MMKKISIMLTSYNLVDHIDVSVGSVVSQKMPCDWELLIGDDGSSDGTVDKIKNWIDKCPQNIKLYQWAREDGSSKLGSRAAMNRANLLERATGDYLIYLDGDDSWKGTEKLKRQFEILENPDNADCSCCGHDIIMYDIEKNCSLPIERVSEVERKYTPNFYWHHNFYFHTNTILFRKECKQLMLTPENRPFMNDRFITFLMLQYGKFYYLPETWAVYNLTGAGLYTSSSLSYQAVREVLYTERRRCINPEMETYMKLFFWFIRAYKYFDENKETEKTKQLVNNVDEKDFPLTVLVSKKGKMNASERIQVALIQLRFLLYRTNNKLKSLIAK